MGTNQLAIGTVIPEFSALPGTDSKQYSLSTFNEKKVLVIVFSCNHCPYVKAYEERMKAFQQDYEGKGVQLVAINANDTKDYPDDDFESMVKRAQEKGFNYPYLRDENQIVASAFNATHTPQFFVFDAERKLRYIGKMDDNYQDPSAVKSTYLRNAVDAILSGQEVAEPETFSIGCTIKWRL
ncbi:MAG: thioredoxin family protein [bacterium]